MRTAAALLTTAVLTVACGGGNTGPSNATDSAPGAAQTAATTALETGANLLQSKGPVEKISMYLDGFHAAKHDPKATL